MCSESKHPVVARRKSPKGRKESSLKTGSKRQPAPRAAPDSIGALRVRIQALQAKAGPRAVAAFRESLDTLARHSPDSAEAARAVENLRRWIEHEEKRQPGLIVSLSSGDDPRQSKAARAEWHGHTVAGLIYTQVIRGPVRAAVGDPDQSMRDDILDTGIQHVRDTVETMQPRDPIERQLIEQLVVQHARFLSLSRLAAQQSQLDSLVKVHEAADRVANTHRRLAMALSDYRNPRPIRAVQVIKQQNNAHQQVVQNGTAGTLTPKNATNKQGCPDGHPDAPALLPDTRGVGISTGGCAACEAVDAEYRPADA